MVEFTIGSTVYRTDRPLDAFQQDKVLRRISPVFAALVGSMNTSSLDQIADAGNALLGNIGPLAEALSQIKDADSDYVLKTCLGVVSRQATGAATWSKLTTPSGDLMFQDIGLLDVYQIVFRVLQENLAGFFAGLATPSSEAGPLKATA
jgi:hypothetical protein